MSDLNLFWDTAALRGALPIRVQWAQVSNPHIDHRYLAGLVDRQSNRPRNQTGFQAFAQWEDRELRPRLDPDLQMDEGL